MVPAGYIAKRIGQRPDWLPVERVSRIYSVSNCINDNFADYIGLWKHNGYWLFDSPDIVIDIARKNRTVQDFCRVLGCLAWPAVTENASSKRSGPLRDSIFEGAAAVAGQELGMQVATEAAAVRFREWASRQNADQDVRMMVPVFHDIGRDRMKVWAILGWATRCLNVSFATPPTARIVNGRPHLTFKSAFRRIAYPVFAEAYVSRLLDRDEFRAHCDRYKTRAEILRQL